MPSTSSTTSHAKPKNPRGRPVGSKNATPSETNTNKKPPKTPKEATKAPTKSKSSCDLNAKIISNKDGETENTKANEKATNENHSKKSKKQLPAHDEKDDLEDDTYTKKSKKHTKVYDEEDGDSENECKATERFVTNSDKKTKHPKTKGGKKSLEENDM